MAVSRVWLDRAVGASGGSMSLSLGAGCWAGHCCDAALAGLAGLAGGLSVL